jgi:hypothetical protein
VAQTAVSIGVFFYTQHKGKIDGYKNRRIHYLDYPEFNAYLDEQENVKIGGIEMVPSVVLFGGDPDAYRELLNEFMSQMEGKE